MRLISFLIVSFLLAFFWFNLSQTAQVVPATTPIYTDSLQAAGLTRLIMRPILK